MSTSITLSRREIVQGLAAGTVVAASGCVTNPETGRSQLMFISDQQLAQMSVGAWDEIKQQEPVSSDRRLNSRLQRVGDSITAAAGRQDQGWEYAVFDTDTVNAFVLPSRQVGFYKGLLDLAENDDQVAAVFGHEVGHVSGRHAAERYSQTIAATGLLTAATVWLASSDVENKGAIAAALGVGVQFGVLLPYSRRHELEADRLGVDYMAAAGYDPRQSLRFWELMNASGGQRPPELLSTHPAPETRMRALDAYIRQKGYA